MAFSCPNCGSPRSLTIEVSIALPPDNRSDDIMLQTVRCNACRFRGAAVYEESRRGSMDSESWDHRGYIVDESDLNWLANTINRCPSRKNTKCRCPAHKELGRKDETERWLMPDNFSWKKSFPMRIR